MRIKVIIPLIIFLPQVLFAEEIVKLKSIHLTPCVSRIYSLGFGNVEVIEKEDVRDSLSSTIEKPVENGLGVDLKTRGKFNIQNDLNIRGAGFEQNLVAIDEINFNDPQSGHFNMDLPLTVYDLDKIQILRGISSSLFGSSAVGGVVNFVTLSPLEDNFQMKSSYGEHQFRLTDFTWDKISEFLNLHLSYENSSASSIREDTDFKTRTIFTKWIFNNFLGRPELIIAGNRKDFGASSFYSSSYPQEEEHTRSSLYILGFDFRKKQFRFSPKFYCRRHYDRFLLERANPDYYKNTHTSHIWGIKLPLGFYFKNVRIDSGVELRREDIKSSNLGKHLRYKVSTFFSFSSPDFKRMIFNFSISGDKYNKWSLEISPSLYLGYRLDSDERVFLSLRRGYRIPSFTELYYSSPANKGNPELCPEKFWDWEIGFVKGREQNNYGLSFFKRFGSNIIDWARNNSQSPWRAENVAHLETEGIEVWLKIKGYKFSYSYLDSDCKTQATYSKYIADYLQHKFLVLKEFCFRNTVLTFVLSYQERHERSGFFNLNLELQRKIKFKNCELTSFLNIDNLTNSSQEEIEEVKLPGRWIYTGLELKF